MCFDLSKTFENIKHKTLCDIMEYMVIRGNALELSELYSLNLMQKVEFNSCDRVVIPDPVNITKDVLQG